MSDEQSSDTAPPDGVVPGSEVPPEAAAPGPGAPVAGPTANADADADAAGPSAASPEQADPPVVVAGGDPLTVLAEQVAALRAEVAAAGAARAGDHDRAAARELVIAHQREELDQLRAERRGTGLRPLVVALQRLRADLLAEQGRADASGSSATMLASFADSVADVLERAGCHRVVVSAGDEFCAGEQQIVRTESVGPQAHGRVLDVLAEGWAETGTGRVLAPARVVVGRRAPDTGTVPGDDTDTAGGDTTGDTTADATAESASSQQRTEHERQEAGA